MNEIQESSVRQDYVHLIRTLGIVVRKMDDLQEAVDQIKSSNERIRNHQNLLMENQHKLAVMLESIASKP